ncbi:MAG: ribbon-helix-helix domain-containing protein [Candidatus Methanoplasma sp.]|jgi:metal-responsive CopG/Arc/MetJ family transcriptional regulator|nr:ribbon-helix-helix domain-containing protein [Candidatus Methanoplasma sp.]
MADKEVTISIRMGTEDIQIMEDFMAENDIDSRSRFVRDAISGYIASKRQGVTGSAGSVSGVLVRFREVQMEALRLMVEDGIAFDEEEYIRKCVLEKLVKPESEADSADRAFKAAQMASKMK